MKNLLRNSLAVLLSAIILVSSTGVVLAAHSCFSKHGTEVSLFVHKGCCSTEKSTCHSIHSEESAFKRECCQLKISYHKVDVSSPVVKNFSLPDLTLFSTPLFNFSSEKFDDRSSSCTFNKAPPLLTGGLSFLYSTHLLKI